MSEQTLTQTEILQAFLASGEALVNATRNLPEETLDCAEAPGEWSIRQIVHHVADDADLWCFAIKKAIACPGAPLRFEGFPGNERWFAALDFSRRPVRAALDLMVAHHQMIAELAACAGDDWAAAYIELFDDKGAALGKWQMGQIIAMLTGHANQHLATIQKILNKA